jgi:glycosyltransferase involved in cell wall biosynthesis
VKVLHLSSADAISSSFNGVIWQPFLAEVGWDSRLIVHWHNDLDSPWIQPVDPRWQGQRLKSVSRSLHHLQTALNIAPSLAFWDRRLFDHEFYREADLVHMHIVHDGWMRLKSIRRVLHEKPTVMTWHDAWPVTGRCIQPWRCERFEVGCGNCPDLLREHAAVVDRSRQMRRLKTQLWESSDFQVHVSTTWMADLVQRSGIQLRRPIQVLPFGIHAPDLISAEEKKRLRDSFGIQSDSVVIGFRSTAQNEKGLPYVLRVADELKDNGSMHFVTVQDEGRLRSIVPPDRVTDLGVLSRRQMKRFYELLDVFLMPSVAESFGMMALEAFAHGIPVAGRPDTAVAEVISRVGAGWIEESPAAMARKLVDFSFERPAEFSSEVIRERTVQHFSMGHFTDQLAALYRDTVSTIDVSNHRAGTQ